MDKDVIAFGPSGNSKAFYDEGYKSTWQAPAWIATMGLNAYEYAGGHGVNIGEETARKIGEQVKARDIFMSIHAPYYINLANLDPERYVRNRDYIISSARAVDWMGGDRVILHLGSSAKRDRGEAVDNVLQSLKQIRGEMVDAGFAHVHLCPETMGRDNQIGTVEDILRACDVDESIIPNIDFAHLHARGRGALNTAGDFDAVLSRLLEGLGKGRMRHFHAHFCRIEYTDAGEKRHWSFEDTQFGPDFAHLAPLLVQYDVQPHIICESAGTMAQDALTMRNLYLQALST